MKNLTFLILTIFYSSTLFAQINFVGVYRIQKNGCGDFQMEQSIVKDAALYELKAKEFKTDHQTENPSTYYLPANKAAIVIQFTTHLYPGACEYQEIRVLKGETLESIRLNYQDLYKRYKGVYVTAPQEIFVIDPNQIQNKPDDRKIVYKSYPNINARFIPQTENGKKAIAAQFTNTNSSKSIAVKVIIRDANKEFIKSETIVLKSGEIITKKMGEADSYEINISDPFEASSLKNNIDFIEKIKNWTKEILQKKEFDKKTHSGIGVRG